jgi:hypothetical protein
VIALLLTYDYSDMTLTEGGLGSGVCSSGHACGGDRAEHPAASGLHARRGGSRSPLLVSA